jgi:hypothetical protein
MSKSKYSSLSPDILTKKINALFKQIDILELFIKNNNNNFEFEEKDKLHRDMDNVDLEYVCNIVTNYHNKLKTEQTIINRILEEKKKNDEQNKIINNDIEDDEKIYENEKKDFEVFTNLEELKRSFFSPDNEEYRPFETIINEYNFKFFETTYKYNVDMYKKPDYMASNLNNGFVQIFEDYKKYLFVCFRCFKNDDNYEYKSYWLFNSPERIDIVLNNSIEDFKFEEIKFNNFIKNFKKMDENDINLINEKYLH